VDRDGEKDMTKTISALALSIMLFYLCSLAEAQQTKKVYRLGVLTNRAGTDALDEAFQQRLHELGYIEGQDIVIERRFAKGKLDRLPLLAVELVGLELDILVTRGVAATRAAKHATSKIPIVMTNASDDPVRQGLVASLAQPGGNITGVIDIAQDLAGKRLELLKEAFPKVSRVAHLSDRASPSGTSHLKESEAASRALGVRLQSLELRPSDLESAFRAVDKEGADALMVAAFGFFHSYRVRIVDLAVRARLPAMYTNNEFVVTGGLMSYAPDLPDQFRRAATYVEKILKGSKPADLPVQQPRKFEFVVNLKTAKQIGLTIPPNVLARADKVIR
jgi:putative ABC transport system substrate-binding protein